MMIPMQVVAAALAAAQPAPAGAPPAQAGSVVRRQVTNSIDIPQVLFAPTFPYSRCLAASHGRPLRSDGQVLPPLAGISPGDDCGGHRRRAVEAGHRALLGDGVTDEAQRTAMIERVLTGFERSFGMPSTPGGAAGGRVEPGQEAAPAPGPQPVEPRRMAASSQPITQISRDEGIVIRSDIAPAVVPYLNCLTVSAGIPLLTGPNGPPHPQARNYRQGQDCSGVRQAAARDADRRLRQGGERDEGRRRERIETTLRDIEAFRRPARETLDLAPEIASHFGPYTMCRLQNRGNGPADPCADARRSATADADAALVGLGGRSEAERQAKIASAVAAIDRFFNWPPRSAGAAPGN